MYWGDLSVDEKDHLTKRRYRDKESVEDLAAETGIKATSLARSMRAWRNERKIAWSDKETKTKKKKSNGSNNGKIVIPEAASLPEFPEMFTLLKRGPVSVRDLSERFDRSENTILDLLEQMEDAGYRLERTRTHVGVPKTPVETVADVDLPILRDIHHEFNFGVLSDLHAGSICCQPTHVYHFLNVAYKEYGVRHILIPGDIHAGIYGYRGQRYDLVPCVRPTTKSESYLSTRAQIWLADVYLPELDDLQYYLIGGNHDWWHVLHSGIDAVAELAKNREDIHFLGYDVGDVPLTREIIARLWHPSGGVPYALSYRLQKNLEQVAFEQLSKLIDDDLPPKLRFLLSGHLHVEVKFQRGPINASICGTFEGQTNYLKRKGLFPSVGGQIWEVMLDRNRQIKRVGYTFMSYPELTNDWENWPLPEEYTVVGEEDEIDILFHLDADDATGVESDWDEYRGHPG